MGRGGRLVALVVGVTLVVLGGSAPARADGLPVVGIDAGPGGVPSTAGDVRYVTLPAGKGTSLAKIELDGGEVLGSAFLPAKLAVPVVALDGTAGGLSRDGSTLVLIRPRVAFPRTSTTLVVVDATALRTRERVTLDGDFSYDALSPDGRSLYLIEYTSRTDPTRYRVRLYDVFSRQLLPDPVVDSREPDERMRGYPITRATSPDGRWEYTLYDGAGHAPFVHALDTVGRTAVCIDLDALAGRADLDLYDLRLAAADDGRTVSVTRESEPLALIDARTFQVSEPGAPDHATATVPMVDASAARAVAETASTGRDLTVVLTLGGLAVAAGGVVGTLLFVRRRRRVVPAQTR